MRLPPMWLCVSERLDISTKHVGPRRYFAKQAVELGVTSGEMAIVSEEPVVSYERPALSKAYLNPEGAHLSPHLTEACCLFRLKVEVDIELVSRRHRGLASLTRNLSAVMWSQRGTEKDQDQGQICQMHLEAFV